MIGQDYVELVRSEAQYEQLGGAIDTITPITFATTTKSSSDNTITISPAGIIESSVTRPIMFKQVTQLGRDSSAGNVEAFFQVEASTDGGTTWFQAGATFNRRVTNPNSVNVIFDFAPFIIQAGVKYRSVWAQSSIGGDPSDPTTGIADAKLVYAEPSAALMTAGLGGSNSAAVIIYGKES